MTSFTELLYGIQSDADGHRVSAPSAWTQGRTLYGGLSAALCLEAVARDHPDLPQLRSAQIAFVGLAIIVYVALKMMWEGWHEVEPFVLSYLG